MLKIIWVFVVDTVQLIFFILEQLEMSRPYIPAVYLATKAVMWGGLLCPVASTACDFAFLRGFLSSDAMHSFLLLTGFATHDYISVFLCDK